MRWLAGKVPHLGRTTAVGFHDENAEAGKIGRVAFEDNGVTLRRPGRMEIVRPGKIIIAVLCEPAESISVGIHHPNLFILRVAAVSREYNFGSVGSPIRLSRRKARRCDLVRF